MADEVKHCTCTPYEAGGDGAEIDCPVHGAGEGMFAQDCTPSGCSCMGHTWPGVRHIAPCCDQPHVDQGLPPELQAVLSEAVQSPTVTQSRPRAETMIEQMNRLHPEQMQAAREEGAFQAWLERKHDQVIRERYHDGYERRRPPRPRLDRVGQQPEPIVLEMASPEEAEAWLTSRPEHRPPTVEEFAEDVERVKRDLFRQEYLSPPPRAREEFLERLGRISRADSPQMVWNEHHRCYVPLLVAKDGTSAPMLDDDPRLLEWLAQDAAERAVRKADEAFWRERRAQYFGDWTDYPPEQRPERMSPEQRAEERAVRHIPIERPETD